MSEGVFISGSKSSIVAGHSIVWALDQWAKRNPDKLYLVWEPNEGERASWTYAEFVEEMTRLAAGLVGRGIRRGDRILIHLENSPEFLLAWFACARIGAVAVCTNTRSVAAEIQYFLDHTRSIGAITQSSLSEAVLASARNLAFVAITDISEDHELSTSSPTGTNVISFARLCCDSAGCPAQECGINDELAIQFTSGTTGRSKAVVFTHANAVWAAQVNAANFKLDQDDITLVQLPLYHINALSYLVWTTTWVGGTIVLQPRVSISSFWPVSLRNRCTVASVLAFAARILAQQSVPQHDYRLWVFGAALPELEAHFRTRFLPFWGMTETVSAGIVGDLSHPGPSMCIGRQAPGYEISLRDGDGNDVDLGKEGRLFVRGERGVSIFKEYLDDEPANRSAFDEDGWFDTGDLVRSDELGNLFFCDRLKDIIRVGGENVSASELEGVINRLEGIRECAVVARSNDILGEEPVAFVELVAGAEGDIAAQAHAICRENLADFKVPREILEIEELPRNTLGKIDKKALRSSLKGPQASAEKPVGP